MTLTPHTETNNGSADLGQRLKNSLESHGFRKVRVHHDNELISVQGRIGERGKVAIRVDRKEGEKEIVLVDVYRRSKIIWDRIDDSDFPEIISIATHLMSQPLHLCTENGATEPTSTNPSVEPHLVLTTITSEATNEPVQSPSKPNRLGAKAIIAAILAGTVVSGTFFYLLSEIRTSHEQIENLKQQLKN
jgi:hypothetical protein